MAVLLVLLFHLQVPGFRAGFLGVDVFFVISGFLITTIILDEIDERGRLSFSGFWARRIRRLLPALVVLILVVVAVGSATATTSQLERLRGDVVATALYAANWHFIEASSYFAFSGTESPLLHTWSLAIEEQFYVVWPLVVVAFVAGRRSLWWLGSFIGLAAASSAVALALLWTPESVNEAYMGTLPRVFEPLLGAGVAVAMRSTPARTLVQRWGPHGAMVGALALAGTVALLDPSSPAYYRGGALLVAVSSALIVVPLWFGRSGAVGALLHLRPVVWIGTISYGIYLWHWPVTLWTGAREPMETRPWRVAAAAAVSVVLAALSFVLVERPIRRMQLEKRRGEHQGLRSRAWRTIAAVPVVVAITVGCAMAATETPAPVPGRQSIVVMGDSVPLRLADELEREAERRGALLRSAALGGCSVIGDTPVAPDGSEVSGTLRCADEVVPTQQEMMDRVDPDIVIWWDRVSIAPVLLSSGARIDPTTEAFWDMRRASLEATVDRLTAGGARVVFVATEPPSESIATGCPPGDGGLCSEVLREFFVDHYADVTQRWNEMMWSYAADHPRRAAFVSLTDVVCPSDEAPCDELIVGGRAARPDGQHYEGEAERLVAETLIDRVLEATSNPSEGVDA